MAKILMLLMRVEKNGVAARREIEEFILSFVTHGI
jgi:hypothetical protein